MRKKRLIRKPYNDGSLTLILEDYSWDLALPNGSHVRGESPDVVKAMVAANAAHDKFVLERWAEGTLAPRSRYIVPLNPQK